MSIIRDLFRRAGQFLMQSEQPAPFKLEPQFGMAWNIVHERRYAHPTRGSKVPITSYQIIGIEEDSVEILEKGCWVTKLSQKEWDDFFCKNLRAAHSASEIEGEGRMVPYYQGIQSIDDSTVERHRNPFVPRIFYSEP